MPPNAPPARHVAVRKEFLRLMNRWKRKHGYTFEIHGILDLTDMHNGHWDITAYSDAPKSALPVVVRWAWRRAGGLRQSLVPLNPEETAAQCRYQAKDLAPDRTRRHSLLRSRREIAIEMTFSTARFWQGHTVDQLWRKVVAEWLADGTLGAASSNTKRGILEPNLDAPDPVADSLGTPQDGQAGAVAEGGAEGGADTVYDASSEGDFGSKNPILVLETPAPGADLAARRAVLERVQRDRVRRQALLCEIDAELAQLARREGANVRAVLPTDPTKAARPDKIATVADLPVEDVEDYLRSEPIGLRVVPLPRGRFVDDLYYLDTPTPPA